ncbi:MAG: hypothetical protein ACYS1A_19745 [Planctomycetota bacterium]|jgi:cytochrome c-type biogenesis protein CcmH/NrfG
MTLKVACLMALAKAEQSGNQKAIAYWKNKLDLLSRNLATEKEVKTARKKHQGINRSDLAKTNLNPTGYDK